MEASIVLTFLVCVTSAAIISKDGNPSTEIKFDPPLTIYGFVDGEVSSKIGTVKAIALDGGKVTYSLSKDDPDSEYFAIDADTGELTIAKLATSPLKIMFTFDVIASANGKTASNPVLIVDQSDTK